MVRKKRNAPYNAFKTIYIYFAEQSRIQAMFSHYLSEMRIFYYKNPLGVICAITISRWITKLSTSVAGIAQNSSIHIKTKSCHIEFARRKIGWNERNGITIHSYLFTADVIHLKVIARCPCWFVRCRRQRHRHRHRRRCDQQKLTNENNNLGKITFTLIVLYWRLPCRKCASAKVFAAQFHWLCAAWLIIALPK